MSRALQIECLLDPIIDYRDQSVASGYTVYFYAAGTSTPKNVWTEKEKTNPYTSRTLGSDGTIQVYGDGIYKIVVKDGDGTTVYTWDNVKVEAPTFSVSSKVGAYSATPDDDVILCTGTFTVTIGSATYPDPSYFTHPLHIKNTGAGTITVDPYGSIQIDSSATAAVTPGDTLTIWPDSAGNVWRSDTAIRDLNGVELILDSDGDTSITADTDDQIDFKIGGTDTFQMSSSGFAVDTITEKTADNGVSIDGLTIKDGKIEPPGSVLDVEGLIRVYYTGGQIRLHDTNNSVDVDDFFALHMNNNVLTFRWYDDSDTAYTNIAALTTSGFFVDTILEYTGANGVSIDGLTIKDGALETADCVSPKNFEDLAVPIIQYPGPGFTDNDVTYTEVAWWYIRKTANTPTNVYYRALAYQDQSSNTYLKFTCGSATSGDVLITGTSGTPDTVSGTIDISGESDDTWLVCKLELKGYNAPVTTITCRNFSMWWN